MTNVNVPQFGGRIGVPPDAVERACLAGKQRSLRAARGRLRRNPLAHRLDLADVAPCLRVALKLVVNRLDRPAQRGHLCRAGGEETQLPPAAQDRGVGPSLARTTFV